MQTRRSSTTRGRRPIGTHRTINGERCILQRYTAKGRGQYRRPNGEVITLSGYHKRRSRRNVAPPINTKVRVLLAGRPYGGRVVRRSPLLIRITQPCPFRGLLLQRPNYKLDRGKR